MGSHDLLYGGKLINFEFFLLNTFNIGLFHLINIHPLWTTFSECPGGCFKLCPGGQRLILMKRKGVFEENLIVSRSESITNYGVLGDASSF